MLWKANIKLDLNCHQYQYQYQHCVISCCYSLLDSSRFIKFIIICNDCVNFV